MFNKEKGLSSLIKSKLINREIFNNKNINGSMLDQFKTPELLYLKDKTYWKDSLSSMFDGTFYVVSNPDLEGLDYAPILHYLNHGYLEGRNPSIFIDINYIVRQLKERNHIGSHLSTNEILSCYSGIEELLRKEKVNPNALFDTTYFCSAQNVDLKNELPIDYYFRNNGFHPITHEPLEISSIFSFKEYLKFNQDIIEAGVNPLGHLLVFGLSEKRLSRGRTVLSDKFLQATSDLYNRPELKDEKVFLLESSFTNQVGGEGWNCIPKIKSLSHVKDGAEKVFIGIVIYKNSEQELTRLQRTIDRESSSFPNIQITVKYLVNDCENLSKYEQFLPAGSVFSVKENVGFGKGHNILMELAFKISNFYVGLNPDGYLIKGCINSLVNFNDYYKGNALVEAYSAPIEHPKWHDPVLLDTKWVSGAAFGISKQIWEHVGGFDEGIHLYCEDVDISWRVKKAGYLLKVCPVAKFFHDVTPRFIEELNEEEEKKRRKNMLLGAYYLCEKWSGLDKAEELASSLLNEGLINSRTELPRPAIKFSAEFSKEVVDFNHDLRFSPSKFW